jgi:hypothetical protein
MTEDVATLPLARELARRALTRAAGGTFINGNRVRLLKDAPENYPAWLEAIARARHHVHFENYIIHDDQVGLNPASWFGNCELDVMIDDAPFALQMEQQYLDDLSRSTEVVLDAKRRVRAPRPKGARRAGGATAAGALRVGNALGAGLIRRRVLEPTEGRLMLAAALVLAAVATLTAIFPRLAAYGLSAVLGWLAVTFAWSGLKALRHGPRPRR